MASWRVNIVFCLVTALFEARAQVPVSQPSAPPQSRPATQSSAGPSADVLGFVTRQIADTLHLDADQQKRLAQIARSYSRKSTPAAEYHDKLAQLRRARREQRAAEVDNLRNGLLERPCIESFFDQFLDDVDAILTDQQRGAYPALRRQLSPLSGKPSGGALGQLANLPDLLKLDAARRLRFDELFDVLRETLKSADASASAPASRAAATQPVNHVRSALAIDAFLELLANDLTDEQKSLLRERRGLLRINPPEVAANPVAILRLVTRLDLDESRRKALELARQETLQALLEGAADKYSAQNVQRQVNQLLSEEQRVELIELFLEERTRRPSVRKLRPDSQPAGSAPASRP